MKFELNEFHRNTSNDELISDVRETANKLGKVTLTASDYTKNGKYHSTTLVRRFGNWEKVLELSSLETKGHNFKRDITESDIIYELHRIAKMIGKDSITVVDFKNYSELCSVSTLNRCFGTWKQILKLAGMDCKNSKITDEELYEEISVYGFILEDNQHILICEMVLLNIHHALLKTILEVGEVHLNRLLSI